MAETERKSDLARLLSSIRWTLETHVALNVQGSLPQSYTRTLLAMLRHAERRAMYEWQAQREDLADLVDVLKRLGLDTGGDPVELSGLDSAAMEDEIARRDRILSRSLPSLDETGREIFDGFVLRRIERERRYLPDSAPADSF